MRDHVAGRRKQGKGVGNRNQQLCGGKINDLAKAANKVRPSNADLVDGKIAKTGVGLGGRMARQEPLEGGRAAARPGFSQQGQPTPGKGIAEPIGGIEQKTCARIPMEIAGVARKPGNQQDRGTIRFGCGQHQRSVRMPRLLVQGGEGALKGSAHDVARGDRGIGLQVWSSGLCRIGGHGATIAIVWVALSRHNMVGTRGICHN